MVARVRQLVAVLRALSDVGAQPVLRSTRNALTREVQAGVSLAQWLSDRSSLRGEKRFLQALLGKAPYVDELLQRHESGEMALEFRFDGQPCPGLGLAHLRAGPAVSLSGHAAFDADVVAISMLRMHSDGTEDTATVEVDNYARPIDVERRRESLRLRILREVASGAELWNRRETLFPRLDFCPRVERQLGCFSGRERYFHEICRHLFVLDDGLAAWTSGAYQPVGVEWSYESKQTLSSRFGTLRRIECPDGETREFSAHTKLRSGNLRIYFLAVGETRRAFVGYVGVHLGTVKYPH